MSFRKYNFIFGKTGSGKTHILKNIAKNSNIPVVFLSSDFDVYQEEYRVQTFQSLKECSNLITSIDPNVPHLIILDCLSKFTQRDSIRYFFKSLPKIHTYFFSISQNNVMNSITSSDQYFNNIKISLSITTQKDPDDLVVFENIRDNSARFSIQIMNHETSESYNIMDIKSIFRDMKINQLL